jgi:PAS domain S-box-containing protein
MGKNPDSDRNDGMRRPWLSRLAWLPIPILLGAMAVLWAADLRTAYESQLLLTAFNFVFSTAASLLVVILVGRSFLAGGTSGLLLLGCGVLVWGAAGTVGPALLARGVNVTISIHNILIWLSALCCLTGAILSLKPRRAPRSPGLTLAMAYAGAACVVWLVVMLVLEGWTPVFFVQGQGGTPVRGFVLGSATVMFVFTTALLRLMNRRPPSAFVRWYGLALLLVATGLLGIMIESVHGGVLSWTGRAAQFLGGAYLLIAAFASVRESHAWRISLEAALREEQDFAAAVLDTVGALVVVLDREGRIVRFNRACERATQYRAAEVLGKPLWDLFVAPEEMEGVKETFSRLTAGQFPVEHENDWIARNGDRRRILWSNTCLMGEKGEVRFVIGTGVDITERKHAEETLRESEERFRTAFEEGTVPMALTALDSTLLKVNSSFCRMLGFSESELVGRSFREITHPDDRAANLVGTQRLACGEISSFRMEKRYIRKDGAVLWADMSTASVRDANGRPLYCVTHVQDITDRKQAEETLRELNATLESKVAQRTAQLQHRARQLQKLTLELSQAEERERRRIAVILHEDLQQQIAGAKFHLSLLKGWAKQDSQEVVEKIDEMLREAIEKSRSLSHDLSPAVLNMNDLAEVLQWLANRVREQYGLTVGVEVSGETTLQSEAMTMFLFRAAQEMLFNVVKHARVNAAAIRVRRIGRYVCLCVSDRGRGFDPQDLKETAGFGLLSIRERVELFGGRMKIKSVKGQGSTFHIVVPDGQKTEDRGQKTVGAGPRACPKPGNHGGKEGNHGGLPLRVLLADDHEIVRQGLVSLLREASGIEVVGEASNGHEAVNLAWELRPDVVIMDAFMPIMSGEEATRQIKGRLPQIRIIALSMHEEPKTIERMYQAGAESYVLKTAPSEELLAAIRGRDSHP